MTDSTSCSVRTSFLILLLHTSYIRLNGCSDKPYRVFSCYLSVLACYNHSLCAEYSLHVFHIIYIWDIVMINLFNHWCLRLAMIFLDFLSSISLPNCPCSFIRFILNLSFFSLALFCFCSCFYFQFDLSLIFLALLQLSEPFLTIRKKKIYTFYFCCTTFRPCPPHLRSM